MIISREYASDGQSYYFKYPDIFVSKIGLEKLQEIPVVPAEQLGLNSFSNNFPEDIVTPDMLKGHSAVKCIGKGGNQFFAFNAIAEQEKGETLRIVEVVYETAQRMMCFANSVCDDEGGKWVSSFSVLPSGQENIADCIRDLLENRAIEVDRWVWGKRIVTLYREELIPIR